MLGSNFAAVRVGEAALGPLGSAGWGEAQQGDDGPCMRRVRDGVWCGDWQTPETLGNTRKAEITEAYIQSDGRY